jgi:hypothetical protein
VRVIETWWRKPIRVRLHNGLEHTFLCVEDTIDFLENEWPTKSGEHYRRATQLCRAALDRTASVDVACEAMISACLEANFNLVVNVQPEAWKQHPFGAAVHCTTGGTFPNQ